MYLAGDGRLPAEYGFMPLDELLRELPADIGDRVLLAVDCANARADRRRRRSSIARRSCSTSTTTTTTRASATST